MRLGKNGGTCGRGNDGLGHKSKLPPIGFEGGATPFHILIPKEPYYKGTQLVYIFHMLFQVFLFSLKFCKIYVNTI